MALEHLLFFKFKPLSQETFDAMLKTAQGLKQKIDGIEEVSFGKKVVLTSDRSNGYTHGFRVRFTKSETLKVYAPHAAHQEFVKMVKAQLDTTQPQPLVCVDYEV